jgi:hypothetical protein
MSALVGNPNQGYQGLHLGAGPAGPVALFFGTKNPNNIVDATTTQTDPNTGQTYVVAGLDRVSATNADLNSVYIMGGSGGGLFVKTAFPNTWTQVSVP